MLIICSGADSYRSLEKARELESAYKMKYDAEGRSVERLASGKEGVEALLSITSSASLFSERRFIRADGIVRACPKTRRDALLKMLSRDVDMTIVVSVEEDDLKEKDIKDYKKLPKFFSYEFPLLPPPLFSKWARAYAEKNGLNDARCIQELITRSQGNSWLFVNEFWKVRAGGNLSERASHEMNIFEVIDAFLQKRGDRWSALRRFNDTQSVISQIGNQSRSLSLIQARHTKGIHPFVVQKMSRLKHIDASERFRSLMTAFVWSRSGMANADESLEAEG